MSNESEEFGYVDVPPQGARGRNNPPKEKKTTFDRPVYSVRAGDEIEENLPADKVNLTVFFIVGLLVLAMAGAFFYQKGVIVPETVVEDVQAPLPQVSGNELMELEKEIIRTISLLEDAEEKLTTNPEKLEKVIKLKREAKDLLQYIKE